MSHDTYSAAEREDWAASVEGDWWMPASVSDAAGEEVWSEDGAQ